MKLRILMLLALLAILLELTACGGKQSSAAGITLVPYTSAQFGIRGVVPKGWVEVKPGQFQTETGCSDRKTVAQPNRTTVKNVGGIG